MAEESEEFRRLKEALGMQADLAEEELRYRHGITAKLDEHGKIEAKTIEVLKLGASQRGKVEQQINKELERILGKEQALNNRKQVLYEKELENYGYFIDDQNNLTKMLSKQNLDLDKEQKKVLERLRKDGVSEEKSKAKKAAVQKAQDEFGDNLAKGLGDLTKGLGSFAMGLADGKNNFTSLNPLIDIVANSLASLAKAIPFVGEAIAGVTKAAAEGAKFVLELMDKNLKAFQELGNAGALVADGMSGVSRQFIMSGMSLEGFKNAIKENAADLAQWGKTVGGGSEKFTKAVGMLTKDGGPLAEAGLELRKLGMTSDDIGKASAGFLSQELKLGRARNMTEEQLAKGTAKYAQELDALQKVTGLSKEDLIKQRNEQLADSRFSASMDVIAEENAAGAEAIKQFALTIKDPELKRGFMDLTSGANTEAAKKALRVMGDTVPDVIEKLKNSKPEELAKNFDQAQTMMKNGAKQAIDTFGKETFALMPDTKVLGSYSSLRDIQNQNNVSLEEALEIQKKQKAAAGDLTETTVLAQQNMERMGQEVWKMGIVALPYASKAVNAFTKSMVDLMKYIQKILGTKEVDTTLPAGNAGGVGKKAVWSDDEINAAKEALQDPSLGKKDRAYYEDMLKRQEANKAAAGGDSGSSSTRSVTPKSGSAPYNPARDSQSASPPPLNPTSQKQLAEAGLQLKKGDVQAEGKHVHPDLIDIAKDIQAEVPGFMQFTGFNDQFHNEKAPSSQHTKGLALDFVVARPPSKKQGKEIVDMMKGLGLHYAQDEYNNASAKSTGGHFHGELKAYDGGVFDGPISGYNVELHGREAIVPLPDPSSMISVGEDATKQPLSSAMTSASSVPSPAVDQLAGLTQAMMEMMENKFDEMISQLSTGNNIQDKLLRNSMV